WRTARGTAGGRIGVAMAACAAKPAPAATGSTDAVPVSALASAGSNAEPASARPAMPESRRTLRREGSTTVEASAEGVHFFDMVKPLVRCVAIGERCGECPDGFGTFLGTLGPIRHKWKAKHVHRHDPANPFAMPRARCASLRLRSHFLARGTCHALPRHLAAALARAWHAGLRGPRSGTGEIPRAPARH